MSALGPIAAIVALLMSGIGMGPASAEPLRIFHFTWVGYGPLFVAEEKGFFAREGIEVRLITNNDHTAAFAGLASGQVDAVAGGLQDCVLFSEEDEAPLVCLLVHDDTRGADGIVATREIQSVSDLEGKSVAVQVGGTPHFYLNALLQEAGLTEADLNEVVDLDADEAAEVFLLGEVDAAVVWEPSLTRARNAEHGHLLIDSSAHPGLVVDALVTRADVLRHRRADFRALGRAWHDGVDYSRAHPEEAYEIFARHLGAGLDPVAVAESVAGLHFYDGDENRQYFGAQDRPGQIYDTVQRIIDVWSSLGRANAELVPADVIAHDLWED